MNPPTEQLIRDFLNRVSVAARGRLGSAERREFLARMRESIERRAGAPGTADLAGIQKLLADLGDPGALVDRERARLAAVPGEPAPAAGPRSGPAMARPAAWMARRSRRGPEVAIPPEPASDAPLTGEIKIESRPITARRRPGQPMQTRPSGQPRPRWTKNGAEYRSQPSAAVSGPDVNGAEPGGPDVNGAEPGGPDVNGAEPGGPDVNGAEPGVLEVNGTRPRVPAARTGNHDGRRSGAWVARPGRPGLPGSAPRSPGAVRPPGSGRQIWPRFLAMLAGTPDSSPVALVRRAAGAAARPVLDGSSGSPVRAGPPGDPQSAGRRRGPARDGSQIPTGPGRWLRSGAQARQAERTARFRTRPPTAPGRVRGSAPLAGARAALGSVLGGVGSTAFALARRCPLEASAIVLMGFGGLIYPPVWLLGAAVALLSKRWDFRDRWVGLAGPVFLVIAGTGILVALGGSHSSIGPYVHEAWTSAVWLSRAGAVLGAAYLTWRVQRGRREPPVPPWNRPHRI